MLPLRVSPIDPPVITVVPFPTARDPQAGTSEQRSDRYLGVLIDSPNSDVMYTGMYLISPSILRSFEWITTLPEILLRYFSTNLSNDACLVEMDDFTSMGTIFPLFTSMKSTS